MAAAMIIGVLITLVPAQVNSPPPLAEDQRASIAQLAKDTQQEAARLKSLLEKRQRELSQIYAEYKLDEPQATKIETEILDVQRQMLANYRRMQVQVRALVGAERFAILKQRLDNLVQSTPQRAKEQPQERSDRQLAKEQPEEKTEQVFSGPQVGEKLPPLKVRGVFGAEAGKELDFVKQAAGKPIVLVFVHDVNRQSIGMTRVLTTYTAGRAKDGLATGVVWLSDDVTEAENALKRVRHALAADAPIGISIDGKEGPGSYGLNRNVMLTILVGNKDKVTANFALVQPSVQADLPKVLREVVRVAGGQVPKLEEIAGVREMMSRAAANEPDPKLRGLLRPVIQLNAAAEDVDKAAAAVEAHVKTNEAARKEVGRIANTIVAGGKLSNYGTQRAQEYLRKWAKEYGPGSKDTPAVPGKKR